MRTNGRGVVVGLLFGVLFSVGIWFGLTKVLGRTCPDAPIPRGEYSSDISTTDDPSGNVIGSWRLQADVANADCVYPVVAIQTLPDGTAGFLEVHPYRIRQDGRIVFEGMGEPLGAYDVDLTGADFTLREVDDGSDLRAIVFTSHPWVHLADP